MNNEIDIKNELKTFRQKRRIALLIMIISLIGVFSAGIYFELFSQEINFKEKPEAYLFYGFILLGSFGAIYSSLSIKTSLFSTLIVACILFFLFIAGKISRGEI